MQAEGSKNFFDGLEFTNKSFYEHRDFIFFLKYLGLSSNKIFSKLDYHPKIKNIGKEVEKFQKFLGIKLNYSSSSSKSKGGYAFKIIVRNTLLSEIFHNALDTLRTFLAHEEWGSNLKMFADSFFTKLLSGDGSVDIIFKNRNIPQARLVISDGNFNYLKDYSLIMEKYGFVPHINIKWKFVRSYCNYELTKMLIDIGAFKDNPNEKKLLFLINSREKSNSNYENPSNLIN